MMQFGCSPNVGLHSTKHALSNFKLLYGENLPRLAVHRAIYSTGYARGHGDRALRQRPSAAIARRQRRCDAGAGAGDKSGADTARAQHPPWSTKSFCWTPLSFSGRGSLIRSEALKPANRVGVRLGTTGSIGVL